MHKGSETAVWADAQSVHLRWLPIHYFNRNAVANLLNIDLSRKVLGLLPVCNTAGPSRYTHCCKRLCKTGSDAWRLRVIQAGSAPPVPNMSICYCWAVTLQCTDTQPKTTTITSCGRLTLLFLLCHQTSEASEGPSIDLYHEHLLNQLGGSEQWQTTSLLLAEEVASLSSEVEGETGPELKRAGSVTVVPPLSALQGLCPMIPCGPAYRLVDAAGCVFRPSLCCVIVQDRLVRWGCSGVLKDLWLTTCLTKLSQPSITDSHCLSDIEITKALTAACLWTACLCAACLSR